MCPPDAPITVDPDPDRHVSLPRMLLFGEKGSEWVFPFLTPLAPPSRKTHSDPFFGEGRTPPARSLPRAILGTLPPAPRPSLQAASRTAAGYRLRGEPEVAVHVRRRGRLAERRDPQADSVEADVLPPAVRVRGFDGDPKNALRQHLVAPGVVLRVEDPSVDSMETTRTAYPSPPSADAASTASPTSEPVAMRTASGVRPSGSGTST